MFDEATGAQVAFARVITDGATFAWLADVFVDESVRGRGVGIALMEGIMAIVEPMDLKRVGLVTADAHELYAKFGFAPLADPDWHMARVRPAEAISRLATARVSDSTAAGRSDILGE